MERANFLEAAWAIVETTGLFLVAIGCCFFLLCFSWVLFLLAERIIEIFPNAPRLSGRPKLKAKILHIGEGRPMEYRLDKEE